MSDLHEQILEESFRAMGFDMKGREFRAVPMHEVNALYSKFMERWTQAKQKWDTLSPAQQSVYKAERVEVTEAYTFIAHSRAIRPKPKFLEYVRNPAAWEMFKDIEAAEEGLKRPSWFISPELRQRVAQEWALGIEEAETMTLPSPSFLQNLRATIADSSVVKATKSTWHAITHPRETMAAWKANRDLAAGLVPELRDEIPEVSPKGAAKSGALKKVAITAAVATTAGVGYALYKSHAGKDPKQPWTQRLDAEQDAPAAGRSA